MGEIGDLACGIVGGALEGVVEGTGGCVGLDGGAGEGAQRCEGAGREAAQEAARCVCEGRHLVGFVWWSRVVMAREVFWRLRFGWFGKLEMGGW